MRWSDEQLHARAVRDPRYRLARKLSRMLKPKWWHYRAWKEWRDTMQPQDILSRWTNEP